MKLKGAIIGCGFFAHNHMQAWNEIKNIEIYDQFPNTEHLEIVSLLSKR